VSPFLIDVSKEKKADGTDDNGALHLFQQTVTRAKGLPRCFAGSAASV